MIGPDHIGMAGQVWGLAAADPVGPVFVTSYDAANLETTVLIAVDLAGAVLWRHAFSGHPRPPRVGPDGAVWVAHREQDAYRLVALDPGGRLLRSIPLEHEPHEHLGAFVVLPDGCCTVWLPAARAHVVPPGRAPRVARHDRDGRIQWATPLRLDRLSFPGVVEMAAHTGWEPQPKRPWTPQTIRVSHWQPLLVSGDRVLAGVDDPSSGIGVCFLADLATGQLVAATEPAPYQHKAIAGGGMFLIGRQGYGAFSSTLYDRHGRAVQTWPSHGMMLVDQHGAIRGPEMENRLPSRSVFRVLGRDGSLRAGPPLRGYYTTYPALDAHGTTVFWRDGTLTAIDADLRPRTLYTASDDRAVTSRVLLLADGQIMIVLKDELLIFRSTGLGPLNPGPWPCGDGNLQGNPVTLE